ncbi:hypothetical protein E2I00_016672 [Balaenoptera physalus]|uniref:DM2 domain-containing protein n=1 Tax=Balaenoptera physalus TaxID=9770 RepID=A0A6A1QBI4_BALPH|nr:hypothetical protein E2I00_016672 [Balaenoptera physalus]
MPMAGLQVGPPAGSPFGAAAPLRPGMPPTVMDPFRKLQLVPQAQPPMPAQRWRLKRRKVADKVLPQRIRELVPKPQAYMDLLAFERKLYQTIARKQMEIQEAIKEPLTQKRKLRICISNMKQKRKFSSSFKSLVIELDKELYGPDDHLVEWHRMPTTQETGGFQVKRPGDLNVKCTLLLMLDHQPPQYKLDPRLRRLLGVHTQTRAAIMQALWLYIKHSQLQDGHEREYVNCSRYFRQIFSCGRLRFSEIAMKRARLLQHPDPIVVNHVISVDPSDQKKTACYDLDVEVDDPLRAQRSNFLASTTNQQEIASLDVKIHETIESINQLKTQRDLTLSFSTDPQDFIQEWLRSQRRDLKIITDVTGNPEEERQAAFFLPQALGPGTSGEAHHCQGAAAKAGTGTDNNRKICKAHTDEQKQRISSELKAVTQAVATTAMELLLSLRCLVPPGTLDSTAGFLPYLCPLYTPNSRQISPKLPESLGNVGYGRYVAVLAVITLALTEVVFLFNL